MKRYAQFGLCLLAAAALAACGSGKNTAGNDQMASSSTDVNAGAEAGGDPFADAERTMNDKMMAAVGSDAGQTWALKMIEHHQGAIDMSKIVLGQQPTADVANMAREDIGKQTKDAGSIRKLLTGGAPDPKSAELYRPAMMDMQQAMTAAHGATVSETYLRKMLAHHKGAVAMSDAALKHGVRGAMKAQIDKTKAENQKDAAMVEAMLSGQPMNMSDDMNGMDMNGMNRM